MGRVPFPHLVALLCGFALSVAVATGCGGDRSNLIPSQRAQELVSQLDAIKAQIESGQCEGLETKIDTFHDDATSLSNQVDSRLRKRINEGVKSLQQHAVDDCDAAAAAKTDTTPTETTPTDTTPTQTQTTETTPTETTPTETTPTTTETTPAPTDTGTTPTTETPPTDTGATPPAAGGDGGGGGDGDGGNGGTPGAEVVTP